MKKTLIEGSDFCVRVLNFPDATVGGAVVEDAEGFNNIFLNARRSAEAQRESFLHELRHIARDDFHNDLSIQEAEAEADAAPEENAALIADVGEHYDTTAEYAKFVKETLGIALNLSECATIEELRETVAFLRSARDPWREDG